MESRLPYMSEELVAVGPVLIGAVKDIPRERLARLRNGVEITDQEVGPDTGAEEGVGTAVGGEDQVRGGRPTLNKTGIRMVACQDPQYSLRRAFVDLPILDLNRWGAANLCGGSLEMQGLETKLLGFQKNQWTVRAGELAVEKGL